MSFGFAQDETSGLVADCTTCCWIRKRSTVLRCTRSDHLKRVSLWALAQSPNTLRPS